MFRSRSLVAGVMLAAVAAACAPIDTPTAPWMARPPVPALEIVDGAHGGTAGFYFLPPMVGQPTFSGTFDADIATLNPRVAICDVTGGPDVDCGGSSVGATQALVVYTTTTTPAITLDLSTPQYAVNWGTPDFADHVYRVHVTAGPAGARRELGYADVLLTTSAGQVKSDVIVINAGRTLPIHFRIETGIAGSLAVSAATPSVTTGGGTDVITATLLDLNGAPVAGATVTWTLTTPATDVASLAPTSGLTGTAGTTLTTLQAGTTPGTAVVTATSAGISNMVSVTVTSAGYRLYVANQGGSVTIYAPGADGDVAPAGRIAGASTGLNNPTGIALDAAGNLYVANATTNTITVYAVGSGGDATPMRKIGGGNTRLNGPEGIALDALGRKLYVANSATSKITVYAMDANGDAAPTDSIVGSQTGLCAPYGVALGGHGQLYVANICGFITVYSPGASGDIAPTTTISTGLSAPVGVAVDAAGQLYVANMGGNSVTIYAPDATPVATIAGGSTGLQSPAGIALDPAGNVYVANTGINEETVASITVYRPGDVGDATPKATIVGSQTRLDQPFFIALSPF